MNKITHQITQIEHLESIPKTEIIIRKRRIMKRKTRSFVNQSLIKLALYSLIATSFLGVGALGCWGLEIINANSSPPIVSRINWQAQKNVCLGAIVVGISAFLASGILGAILSGDE